MTAAPRILVFDSGLGGLTVFAEIASLRPDADFLYLADDAFFPYGPRREDEIVARVCALIGEAIAREEPDIVVIACNTASTLVLPHLRAAHRRTPFVGTVPAIKPAAEASRSRMISVLATPGTVARDYTQALIRDHAAHCDVTLVGAPNLAALAEEHMHGASIDDALIAAEIAPCFVRKGERVTDHIVLACTHYPLLRARFETLAAAAPFWAVDFVDPAPAIARRVDHVLSGAGQKRGPAAGPAATGRALLTSGVCDASLRAVFAARGLAVD